MLTVPEVSRARLLSESANCNARSCVAWLELCKYEIQPTNQKCVIETEKGKRDCNQKNQSQLEE
jgi:hypothetical protein